MAACLCSRELELEPENDLVLLGASTVVTTKIRGKTFFSPKKGGAQEIQVQATGSGTAPSWSFSFQHSSGPHFGAFLCFCVFLFTEKTFHLTCL